MGACILDYSGRCFFCKETITSTECKKRAPPYIPAPQQIFKDTGLTVEQFRNAVDIFGVFPVCEEKREWWRKRVYSHLNLTRDIEMGTVSENKK